MDFTTSMTVAASGLRAQSERMKTISENIANANSTAATPGGDPYRRKIPTMNSEFDRPLNATMVETGKPVQDSSEFRLQYDPGNPVADDKGYVKLPNVNSLVEIMDMRDAQRSYEADLTVMDATKSMLSRTVNLLSKKPVKEPSDGRSACRRRRRLSRRRPNGNQCCRVFQRRLHRRLGRWQLLGFSDERGEG